MVLKGVYGKGSGGGGGGVNTDIAVASPTGTTIKLTSSTGVDATLMSATQTQAGLFSAADKAKLDGVSAATPLADWAPSSGTFPGGGTAAAGTTYVSTGAGTVDGIAFAVGDQVTARINNASTTTYAANWVKSAETGGGATNLALGTPTGTTVIVASDTGADATLAAATATDAGVMAAADKVKLDAVPADPLRTVGDWDPTTGTFPGGGTAKDGERYLVIGTGTVDGVSFAPGDAIEAIVDSAATTTYAANWHKTDNQAGAGVTNLTVGTKTATTLDVESSTGANATLPVASVTEAGLLSAPDKVKIDAQPQTAAAVPFTPAGNVAATELQAAVVELDTEKLAAANLSLGTRTATTLEVSTDAGTNAVLPGATQIVAGMMLAADKAKLDGSELLAKDDQSAAEVPVTPTGNLASNQSQAAFEELQTDIDALVALGASNYDASAANPLPADAQDGDFWLNVVSGDIFGPKAAGAWGAAIGNAYTMLTLAAAISPASDDVTGAVGTGTQAAREDHKHPQDVDLTAVRALSGTAATDVDLGTFIGTTIPDTATLKAALQALETALEARTKTARGYYLAGAFVDFALAPITEASIEAGDEFGVVGNQVFDGVALDQGDKLRAATNAPIFTTFAGNWSQLHTADETGIPPWAVTTSYTQGRPVTQNSKFYIAQATHTSDAADFNVDLAAGRWLEVGPSPQSHYQVSAAFDFSALALPEGQAVAVQNSSNTSGQLITYGAGGTNTLKYKEIGKGNPSSVAGQDSFTLRDSQLAIMSRVGTDIFVTVTAYGSDQADAWQAAFSYVQGDVRSASEPDAGDADFGKVFNWFHLPTGPRVSGATFDVTEKTNWQRMAVDTDPEGWTTVDGDVAGIKLIAYGQQVRLIGSVATNLILGPTPGGQNLARSFLILNDSTVLWQIGTGSNSTRQAGNAANDPDTLVDLKPNEQIIVVSVDAFNTIYTVIGAPAEEGGGNQLVTPAGDVTLAPVNDGATGTAGSIYILTTAANLTLPAISSLNPTGGIYRLRVTTDWTLREALVTPPTITTQGADVLSNPNEWPAAGKAWVDLVAVDGTNWRIVTGGEVDINFRIPEFANLTDAQTAGNDFYKGDGTGNLNRGLYFVDSASVPQTVVA